MYNIRPLAFVAALLAPLLLVPTHHASAAPLVGAAALNAGTQTRSTAPVINVEANSIKVAPGIYVGSRTSTPHYQRQFVTPNTIVGARNNHRHQYVYRNHNYRNHNRRRYYNPGIYFSYPYYDPYYYDPYYYDPYYYSQPSYRYTPPARYGLSCSQVLGMLRNRGYRHIQAHDCTGKVYTFYAYHGRKHYKLRVYASNGSFKSRKRI